MEKILVENILYTIEESKDLTMLSIEELARSLEAHEQHESLDQVFQVKLDLKGGIRNTRG